jgi:hypothetical protein
MVVPPPLRVEVLCAVATRPEAGPDATNGPRRGRPVTVTPKCDEVQVQREDLAVEAMGLEPTTS